MLRWLLSPGVERLSAQELTELTELTVMPRIDRIDGNECCSIQQNGSGGPDFQAAHRLVVWKDGATSAAWRTDHFGRVSTTARKTASALASLRLRRRISW